MLKIVLFVFVAAVATVLGLAATRPGVFVVRRSALIEASPVTLVGMVEDFHQWGEWSPWEKVEPEMSRTYEGPARGLGSAYAWSGKKVGAGRMEIQKVVPAREVEFRLDFIKPFKATNTGRFVFEPQGHVTLVTWTMEGKVPFVSKVMGLFFNMDRMIGKDFETGLANMKAAAEKRG